MALDPATWAAIAQGVQAAGNAVSSAGGQKLSKEQIAQQQRQFDADLRQKQAQQALMASQMDPLAQQQSRQRMALVEQIMKSASAPTLNGNKFEGGFKYGPEQFKEMASFFSPAARQNAEAQFGLNATAASGGQYAMPSNYPGVGTMAGVGYGQPNAAPTTTAPPATSIGTDENGDARGRPDIGWEPDENKRRRRPFGR